MIDLARTTYSNTIERPVPSGVTIDTEGLVLVSVLSSGVENLQLSAASTSNVIAGFAWNRNIVPATEVVIEDTLSIPAASPYTVQLQYVNLVSGTVRIHDVTDAVDYTVTYTGSPSATHTAVVNATTGLVTFHSANAGHPVVVTYRRNLTVVEERAKYRQAPVNAPDAYAFGRIVAITGNGEIYTDAYDTSVSYDTATTLYAGVSGLITSASGSATAIPGSRIVSVPSASNPFLGLRFNLA